MDDDGPTPSEPPSPGARETELSIDIVDDGGLTTAAQRRWVRERGLAALAARGAVGEVRARIIADDEMADAHERWSGVAGTTDVLTFDLRDGDRRASEDKPLDVDLLLCADEAGRQAEARGLEIERELLLYLVHGVLHCLGFDDHDEREAARMHAEEDRLLTAAGVGATFSVRAKGAAL